MGQRAQGGRMYRRCGRRDEGGKQLGAWASARPRTVTHVKCRLQRQAINAPRGTLGNGAGPAGPGIAEAAAS